MRRTALLVVCFATFFTPVFAQTVTRPNDDLPTRGTTDQVERDGQGERDAARPIIVVSDPVVVPQKTRSLVSRSSTKGRIDFNIPWQTGIYQ